MLGCQLLVQPKIHTVGAAVLRCILVDRYAYARNDLRNGLRKILYLVIPHVAAHVDGQECPRRLVSAYGPVECSRHIPDVDQRSPWRPVAQNRNLLAPTTTSSTAIHPQAEPQPLPPPA